MASVDSWGRRSIHFAAHTMPISDGDRYFLFDGRTVSELTKQVEVVRFLIKDVQDGDRIDA